VTTGSRIRHHRQRAGLTQEVLAGLAGVSPSWISQVERGIPAPDSLRCLIPVARVLRVSVVDLMEIPRTAAVGEGETPDGLAELVVALRHDPARLPAGDAALDLGAIGRRLDHAESLRRSCRYSEAGPMLAGLIADTESVVRTLVGSEREQAAFGILAHVYRATSETLRTAAAGHDAAWVAADRCRQAAERARDVVVQGYAARSLAHVFAHLGWSGEALDAVMPALDMLAPHAQTSPAHRTVWGALFLVGAVSAARSDDRASAARLLRQAEAAAADGDLDRDGDPYIFGPTNVAIHRLSVAIELGDATDALRLDGVMTTSRIPPSGADRHAWVHLDVARAYDMKRQDEAALHRLLEAERIAPELIRHHRASREMVSAMLHRREGLSATPGLRELADRVGVLDRG
jgi:transcriptional regulator with XRE-family HTH domain